MSKTHKRTTKRKETTPPTETADCPKCRRLSVGVLSIDIETFEVVRDDGKARRYFAHRATHGSDG